MKNTINKKKKILYIGVSFFTQLMLTLLFLDSGISSTDQTMSHSNHQSHDFKELIINAQLKTSFNKDKPVTLVSLDSSHTVIKHVILKKRHHNDEQLGIEQLGVSPLQHYIISAHSSIIQKILHYKSFAIYPYGITPQPLNKKKIRSQYEVNY